jgi:hypothetical protein
VRKVAYSGQVLAEIIAAANNIKWKTELQLTIVNSANPKDSDLCFEYIVY